MNSTFSICENNHVWKQEMDRRTKELERRLQINPVNKATLRDLEKSSLRYRFANAITGIVRRPVATQSTHPSTDVRPATNR